MRAHRELGVGDICFAQRYQGRRWWFEFAWIAGRWICRPRLRWGRVRFSDDE
jgi:hypothetical protein